MPPKLEDAFKGSLACALTADIPSLNVPAVEYFAKECSEIEMAKRRRRAILSP